MISNIRTNFFFNPSLLNPFNFLLIRRNVFINDLICITYKKVYFHRINKERFNHILILYKNLFFPYLDHDLKEHIHTRYQCSICALSSQSPSNNWAGWLSQLLLFSTKITWISYLLELNFYHRALIIKDITSVQVAHRIYFASLFAKFHSANPELPYQIWRQVKTLKFASFCLE